MTEEDALLAMCELFEFATGETPEQFAKRMNDRRPKMDARCVLKKCEKGCSTYCKAARERKY